MEKLIKLKDVAPRLAISKSGLYRDLAFYVKNGLQVTAKNKVVESSIDTCIANMAKANN